MSLVLVKDTYMEERLVYFVSKVFRGLETHYLKIEHLTLVIIVAARKLRLYFQDHKIFVKTNFLVRQVLKKPNLKGRMISWAVELLDTTYSMSQGEALNYKLWQIFWQNLARR